MGKFDNLNDSQLPDLIRRIERLERAAPMNNAAIGRGGIEVYDGGVIRITNGGLSVTGTATITGTLQADGTIAFTGTFTQSGPSTFTGTTNLNGPTNIAGLTSITGDTTVTGDFTTNGPMKTTGTLSVEGVTTLKNDLNVTTGKINAGGVTIDPAYLSGSVKFSNGTYLAATPNGAQMVKSDGGAVTVSTGQADVGIAGGGAFIATASTANAQFGTNKVAVTSTGTTVTGPLAVNSNVTATGNATVQGIILNPGITTTTNAANMHMNSSFRHYLVSSASRYKVDPQVMDLPDSLLDVPVKDWWDRGEVERDEAVRRVPGVIAEEVEAAGGEAFVTYDEDGTIQGVAYDRYALARTAVLARKLDAALARIKGLEDAA